jgi:hypothetical protein
MRGDAREFYKKLQDMGPETPLHVLRDFVEGALHQDYINELVARQAQMKEAFMSSDSKGTDDFNKGGIQAMTLAESIFTDMVANAELDIQPEEDENETIERKDRI